MSKYEKSQTALKTALLDILSVKPRKETNAISIGVTEILAKARKVLGSVSDTGVINQLKALRREGLINATAPQATRGTVVNTAAINRAHTIHVSAKQREELLAIKDAWKSRPERNGKPVPPSKHAVMKEIVPPLDIGNLQLGRGTSRQS